MSVTKGAYRLSCRVDSFGTLSHGGALQVIADIGLEGAYLTVSVRHPHVRPAHVVANPKAAAVDVRERLDAAGLEVADVYLLDEVPTPSCGRSGRPSDGGR